MSLANAFGSYPTANVALSTPISTGPSSQNIIYTGGSQRTANTNVVPIITLPLVSSRQYIISVSTQGTDGLNICAVHTPYIFVYYAAGAWHYVNEASFVSTTGVLGNDNLVDMELSGNNFVITVKSIGTTVINWTSFMSYSYINTVITSPPVLESIMLDNVAEIPPSFSGKLSSCAIRRTGT